MLKIDIYSFPAWLSTHERFIGEKNLVGFLFVSLGKAFNGILLRLREGQVTYCACFYFYMKKNLALN